VVVETVLHPAHHHEGVGVTDRLGHRLMPGLDDVQGAAKISPDRLEAPQRAFGLMHDDKNANHAGELRQVPMSAVLLDMTRRLLRTSRDGFAVKPGKRLCCRQDSGQVKDERV
jgi:hypothetical protein